MQEDSVIRKFRITADDGKTYNANHYSLEMIIAVGFKVNSERAVQFRKWVNQIAKDYTIKGWVMDVERIKRGTYLTENTLTNSLNAYGKYEQASESFTRRLQTFTLPLSTMTEQPPQPSGSTQRFRTKCTLPSTVTPQPSLSWSEPTIARSIWGLLHGRMPPAARLRRVT